MIGLRALAAASQLAEIKSSRITSIYVLSDISFISAPAAKAFSEPVSTMQPIESSASNFSMAWVSSSISASHSALSALGRWRVMRPTLSRCSTRIFSYFIKALPSQWRKADYGATIGVKSKITKSAVKVTRRISPRRINVNRPEPLSLACQPKLGRLF